MPMSDDKPNWRQRFVEWIARLLRVPLYTWPYLIVLDATQINEALKAERAEGEELH